MNAVSITGKKTCTIVQQPIPRAKENFVVVKIHSAPLCTEYKMYRDGERSACLGHEAAGEVVEIAQLGKVRVGDRVVVMPQYPCGRCSYCIQGEYIHCQNNLDAKKITGNSDGLATYAQYLIKQDWLLLPLTDDISYDQGSMACCGYGPTFGAMQTMHVESYDTVLITGMGPVGLGGVINGVLRGARIIAVSGTPYRAELAKELGADAVIHPEDSDALEYILSMTDGLGVDKAIECSGASNLQRFCIDAVRRKGQCAFIGESGSFEVNISDDLLRKGLQVHGTWHWNLRDTDRMMKTIWKTRDKIEKLITHRFPLNKVKDAWELQLTRKCGKVILQPWV